ncbi:unnamed protein product [Urochloa humidicola]
MRTGGDAPAEGELPCRSGGVRARKRRCRLRPPSPPGAGGVRDLDRPPRRSEEHGQRRASPPEWWCADTGVAAPGHGELPTGAEPSRPSSAHPLAHLQVTPATKPLVSSAHAGPKVGLCLARASSPHFLASQETRESFP